MSNKIYRLKIMLCESEPPIWRRVLVPEDINLHKLHEVFQAAVGWEDYHLYSFDINGYRCDGQPEHENQASPENKIPRAKKLNQLITKEKQKFDYLYDFGDSWEHKVVLEKILDRDKKTFYPVCIDGENVCPPEDIGGIWGYYEHLERLKNGTLTGDELECTFGHEDFLLEEFDIEEANDCMKEYFS